MTPDSFAVDPISIGHFVVMVLALIACGVFLLVACGDNVSDAERRAVEKDDLA